jgi:hypothetical protein
VPSGLRTTVGCGAAIVDGVDDGEQADPLAFTTASGWTSSRGVMLQLETTVELTFILLETVAALAGVMTAKAIRVVRMNRRQVSFVIIASFREKIVSPGGEGPMQGCVGSSDILHMYHVLDDIQVLIIILRTK